MSNPSSGSEPFREMTFSKPNRRGKAEAHAAISAIKVKQ
jgi:hypothetical protein